MCCQNCGDVLYLEVKVYEGDGGRSGFDTIHHCTIKLLF